MTVRYQDWRQDYQSRLKTPDQAVEAIKEGDLVSITILCPAPLVAAFVNRAKQLGRVDFRTLAPGNPDLFNPEFVKGEKEIEIFIGDSMRPAHDAKIATYLPNTFMLGMKAFDNGRPEARMPDVFLTPCSEPNEQGYVHFGPHMWQRKSYATRCKKTIAIVDPNMSKVHGDVWMHVSEIDTFIEDAIKPVDRAGIEERVKTLSPEPFRPELLSILNRASNEQLSLVEMLFHAFPPDMLKTALGEVAVDPAAQAIADNLRPLIRDGDTIQVGVGQPSSLMFLAGAFDDANTSAFIPNSAPPASQNSGPGESSMARGRRSFLANRSLSPGVAATARTIRSSPTTRHSSCIRRKSSSIQRSCRKTTR